MATTLSQTETERAKHSAETIRARATAADAAVTALQGMPREERRGVSPLKLMLPEIAEAAEYLVGTGLELRSCEMADGSGFAEVRSMTTYGVMLSSERYPFYTDRIERYVALATVAQRVLAGEVD